MARRLRQPTEPELWALSPGMPYFLPLANKTNWWFLLSGVRRGDTLFTHSFLHVAFSVCFCFVFLKKGLVIQPRLASQSGDLPASAS